MSATHKIIPHDHVTEYVSGSLSAAKSIMISCQRDICSAANDEIAQQEQIASLIVSEADGAPLSDSFMTKALHALNDAVVSDLTTPLTPKAQQTPNEPLLPRPIAELLGDDTVDWSFFAPGIKSASIYESKSGEHIWMMKVKGGVNMPEHTHIGEEWSLLLQGSYHVGTTQYSRGDLHVEDEHCTHIPKIDPGVDCICLVLTEGPLMPTKLLPKLLMPFARI